MSTKSTRPIPRTKTSPHPKPDVSGLGSHLVQGSLIEVSYRTFYDPSDGSDTVKRVMGVVEIANYAGVTIRVRTTGHRLFISASAIIAIGS